MLTKIIVTLSVIVACLWFVSAKREQQRAPLRVVISNKDLQRKKLLRRFAYAFMGLMLCVAGVMLYLDILDEHTLVTVHLVNAQTGERSSFKAKRQDIESGSFTTIDGRKIFVSSVERIEVETR